MTDKPLREDLGDGNWRDVDPLELLDRDQLIAEIHRLTPQPGPCEPYHSPAYSLAPVEPHMYDTVIEDLKLARQDLIDKNTMGCSYCGSSDHTHDYCHHNVLLLARRWAAATRVWQCYHCGYIATNDEEGREHFGLNETYPPKCQRET